MYTTHMIYPEEDDRCPGAVTSEPPRGYWELNLGPLEEQQAPLPTAPSLQPLNDFL